MKKNRGIPFRGVKVRRQRWRVRGWLQPEKIRSRHFETTIDCMVMKLTVYIRNVISFSYRPKIRWNLDI